MSFAPDIEPWVTADEVQSMCVGFVPDPSLPNLLSDMAYEATTLLFVASGRQFTGQLTRVVRPTRIQCQCWGPSSLGLGPWNWSTYPNWGIGSWGWRNESGDQLGCKPMSTIRLAGYPVTDIVDVLIDGVVLPEHDVNGNLNYRLDKWRELVRMDDPTSDTQTRLWPGCQNLSLEASQKGTFQITYISGMNAPSLGRDAAAILACELAKSATRQPNNLPTGATVVKRQGVTVERGILANWFDPAKTTGLPLVDAFIRAYWPQRRGRQPAVWSPDTPRFPRREGASS